jgi:hypothetical protein
MCDGHKRMITAKKRRTRRKIRKKLRALSFFVVDFPRKTHAKENMQIKANTVRTYIFAPPRKSHAVARKITRLAEQKISLERLAPRTNFTESA